MSWRQPSREIGASISLKASREVIWLRPVYHTLYSTLYRWLYPVPLPNPHVWGGLQSCFCRPSLPPLCLSLGQLSVCCRGFYHLTWRQYCGFCALCNTRTALPNQKPCIAHPSHLLYCTRSSLSLKRDIRTPPLVYQQTLNQFNSNQRKLYSHREHTTIKTWKTWLETLIKLKCNVYQNIIWLWVMSERIKRSTSNTQ